MKANKSPLGVMTFSPDIHEDYRGKYIETYNEETYNFLMQEMLGHPVKFVQDDMSVSYRGVLRGLHGDPDTWKLVDCPYGRIYLVVLDPVSGDYETFIISDENHLQVLIPAGFANGHFVISEQAIFHYKQSTYYKDQHQFTIKWNDPKFNIQWPLPKSRMNPITSKRDRA